MIPARQQRSRWTAPRCHFEAHPRRVNPVGHVAHRAHTVQGVVSSSSSRASGEGLDKREVGLSSCRARHGGFVASQDLATTGSQLDECFATRPSVLPPPHCPIAEVSLAICASFE